MVFMISAIDGKFKCPLAWYATTGMPSTEMVKTLDLIETMFLANDLILAAISGDGSRANMATFAHYEETGRFISHPDYPHLIKNIRTHLTFSNSGYFL